MVRLSSSPVLTWPPQQRSKSSSIFERGRPYRGARFILSRDAFPLRCCAAMSTLLIHAGRALTPTAEINDAGILIREDVIEAVGPRSSMTLPAGAREIHATDKTAIPGFIDVHIH